MNTTTHIMLSVALLTRGRTLEATGNIDQTSEQETYIPAAIAGAVVPDAAMFLFYAVEKGVFERSEKAIWSTQYFLPAWQDFFDLFNSIPLAVIGVAVAWAWRRPGLLVFFASILLHIACDLPLHHDDGHRHFWPIFQWKFASPVSYWDPRHFGNYAAVFEFAVFLGSYVIAVRKHKQWGTRISLTVLAILHTVFMGLALAMYM